MVVFRHTDKIDTTSTSQANGISFDISHSCVDIIVRWTIIYYSKSLWLIFILSFYLFPSRDHAALAVGAPTIIGAQSGTKVRPQPWPATCAAPSSPSSRGSGPAESAATCSAPCVSPRSHRPGEPWFEQRGKIILRSPQTKVVCSVRGPQQETSSSRRTDEAQSEGSTAFPHAEENKYQVLRR